MYHALVLFFIQDILDCWPPQWTPPGESVLLGAPPEQPRSTLGGQNDFCMILHNDLYTTFRKNEKGKVGGNNLSYKGEG